MTQFVINADNIKMPVDVKAATDKAQEMIIDVLEECKLDSIVAYGLLTHMTKSMKKYIKEVDGLDIDEFIINNQQVGEQTPSDSRASGGIAVRLGDSVVSDKPADSSIYGFNLPIYIDKDSN